LSVSLLVRRSAAAVATLAILGKTNCTSFHSRCCLMVLRMPSLSRNNFPLDLRSSMSYSALPLLSHHHHLHDLPQSSRIRALDRPFHSSWNSIEMPFSSIIWPGDCLKLDVVIVGCWIWYWSSFLVRSVIFPVCTVHHH
jgi:hypothetical protein